MSQDKKALFFQRIRCMFSKKQPSARKIKAKRIIPISWRKLIPGIVLIGLGIGAGAVYLNAPALIVMGVIAALAIATGLFLIRWSFQSGEFGYSFDGKGKKKHTGNENAIILYAKRNPFIEGKAIPVIMKFAEITHIPTGARLHYLRNEKRHYYELFNNLETKKLEPAILKDKKSFPPWQFVIASVMQAFKDALEFSPPTLMQKFAPGILLLGMIIVGILMVMTGG